MDVLKVYSVRLESGLVGRIEKIANDSIYWSRSDVMRLAMWIGEKVIDCRHLPELQKLWWQESFNNCSVSIEDVLRAAATTLENLKS